VRGIQDLERGVRRFPRPETLRRLNAALPYADAASPQDAPVVEVPLTSLVSGRLSGRFPVAYTSFVARNAQVLELGRLLGVSRLVTLVGPGGVGRGYEL
jgi:hypothetical protein